MPKDGLFRRTVQRMGASPTFGKLAPHVVPKADRLLHKVTRGRFMLAEAMMPELLLTTTGAKSGQPRHTPLSTMPADDGWYLVGSNFGGKSHPAWSYNLLAHPEATIEIRGTEIPVTARLLTSEEKAVVWPQLTAIWPPYDNYVERSGRDLRVFHLTRR